jgi:hypothetical protein
LFAAGVVLVLGVCIAGELQQGKIYDQSRRPSPAPSQHGIGGEPVAKPLNHENPEKGNENTDWYKSLSDGLLVLFNGLLAAFTWRLYRATSGLFTETAGLRQAADQQRADMLRSIEATEKAAAATETSAKTAREAWITTERAFVFLEDVDVSATYGARGSPHSPGHTGWEVREFIVKPRWRNNGNTPTRDMTVLVNWTPWGADLPEGFSYAYGEDTKPAPMYLGPEATEWSDAVHFNAMEVTQVLEGKQSIFIWGRCDYRDVFDGTAAHHTIWCYRLIFTQTQPRPETQFVAFGPHNGSDQDTAKKQRGA